MAVAYTTDADPENATRELGTTWELERISLRRWPAASSVQSLIELCLRLLREHHIDVRNVESVAIELGPSAYRVSGGRGWADSLSAQQSARWVAAAGLHDGDWWIEQSSAARIGDPDVSSFARERVSVVMAPDLGSAAGARSVAPVVGLLRAGAAR